MNSKEISLPPLFLNRLQTILSAQHYQEYLNAFDNDKYTAFRINHLKTTDKTVLENLASLNLQLKKITWCDHAYSIPEHQKALLTNTSEFQERQIYIQNPSSMFASLILDPQRGEEILDMAAAPGGKTLHIAAIMNNTGRIAAVEAVKDRFFKLRQNVLRANATIVDTYHKDSSRLWRVVPERFDRVLLDAPCSSEARFDPKDPKSFVFWSERKIMEMHRKQKKLIYSAVHCLKPGGELVYSTCSFAPEENEMIVQYALDKFDGQLEILPVSIPFENYQTGLTKWEGRQFSEELKRTVRIIPDGLMSGFYLARLTKRGQVHT